MRSRRDIIVLPLIMPILLALVPGAAQALPNSSGVSKVMIIMEENHGTAEAVAGMPKLMAMANGAGAAWLTNYYAATHPSKPNYIVLTSGVLNQTQDCSPSVCPQSGQSVFGAAIAAGNTAASYQESMPSNCYSSNASPYAVRHNPWAYYNDPAEAFGCANFDVPLNVASVTSATSWPNVSLVTPNLNDDAHSPAPLSAADDWLAGFVPAVLSSSDYTSGALAVIVTFDESSGTCGCSNNVISAVFQKDLHGGPITGSSRLTHYDTYNSLLAVGTGNGTGPLLAAFLGPTSTTVPVYTAAATSVTSSGATLNGTVNPPAPGGSYHFEYGTSTSYGSAAPQPPAGASATQNVSTPVTTLTNSTTYHFRLVLTDGNLNSNYGADQSFTTAAIVGQAPPTVATGNASAVSGTGATLNGTINPNGADTTYHFDYGPTRKYGYSTSDATLLAGSSVVPVNTTISGLNSGTKYHYRLVGTNTYGTTYGLHKAFTTTP
jgi:phosphatidylinositol-3-phosphatase